MIFHVAYSAEARQDLRDIYEYIACEYRTGVSRGLPVGMGYFSVSFGFGAIF